MAALRTMNLAGVALVLALSNAQAVPATTSPAAASRQQNFRCLLAPELRLCDAMFQRSLHDSAPASQSLHDTYERYARYLTGRHALTDADRQYLRTGQFDLPNDLTPEQTSGLHNVINDPALRKSAADRKSDVTNYLLRAEEANIYCGLQSCSNPPES